MYKCLIIASSNKGKFAEIATMLKEINIQAIVCADDFVAPQEDGDDFGENAAIKAKYYGDRAGQIALADDSGLSIDALDGRPGIHSARFAFDPINGKANFTLAFDKIATLLREKGIEPENDKSITAHFICNLAIYDPKDKKTYNFEGRVDGRLTFPPRGNRGFGYDPIFIPNGHQKTFGEMSISQKEQISHRRIAFNKFIKLVNSA